LLLLPLEVTLGLLDVEEVPLLDLLADLSVDAVLLLVLGEQLCEAGLLALHLSAAIVYL